MMKSNTRTIAAQAACVALFSFGGLGCPTPGEEDSGVDAALLEDVTQSDAPLDPSVDAALDAALTDDAAIAIDARLAPIPDAGPPDAYCNCDDGIACTIDSCVGGRCMNVPDHTRCMGGQFCGALIGCTTGQACSFAGECPPVADCFTVGCLGMCTYTARDFDGDGHADARCGGDDCNDLTSSTYPGAAEYCDGLEQDCGTDGEPADALGCDPGATCISGRCTCVAPASNVCASTGALCVDRMTDERACGGCGLQCDGTCTGGVCTCSAGQTACVINPMLTQCVDTATTEAHCGACGRACLDGATCTASMCSVDPLAGWRTFGAPDARSVPAVSARHDSFSGRSAVRVTASSNFYVYPRVAPRLFFIDSGILTHAADGSLLHHFPEEVFAISDYAISGDALWVLVPPGARFGGVDFAPCTLARFDATTGALLGARDLGYSCPGALDADGAGGVVLYTGASTGQDFGGGPIADFGNVVARYGSDGGFRSAFRLPLEIASNPPAFAHTSAGIVVIGAAPAGGAMLGGVTYPRYRRVVARFSPTGDFLNAFEVTGSATQFFATATHTATCADGACQLHEFVGTSAFPVGTFPLGTFPYAAIHGVASSGTSLWLATSVGVTRVNTLTGSITESVSFGSGVLSFELEAPNRAAVVVRTERPFETGGTLQPAGRGYGLGHLRLTP